MDRKTKEGANLLSRRRGCEAVALFFWGGEDVGETSAEGFFFSLPRVWLGKKVKGGVVGSRGGSKVTFAPTPHSLKKKQIYYALYFFRYVSTLLFSLPS